MKHDVLETFTALGAWQAPSNVSKWLIPNSLGFLLHNVDLLVLMADKK